MMGFRISGDTFEEKIFKNSTPFPNFWMDGALVL